MKEKIDKLKQLSKKKKLAIGAIIVIVLTVLIASCDSGDSKKQKEVIRPVVYKKVSLENTSVKRTYSGTVNSNALSNLSFRVSGTINKRIAQLGDVVKTGDVLATLDPIEYEVNYQKVLENLDKGKAVLTEATSNFKRAETLYLENSISKASYDSATANYKSALSSVNALKEELKLAKIQLGYTSLKAPTDGSIGEVKSEVNQTITPNSVIFVLNTAGERFVDFNVSQSVVNNLKLGERVNVYIPSLGDVKLKGEIANIGSLSVGYGSTYPVKAKIIDDLDVAKVGMIAKITLETDENKEKVVTVPLTAIVASPSGEKYVFLVKNIENGVGTLKKQKVTVGNHTATEVEITSGIVDGDYVVTKGTNTILENQKVSVAKRAD